MKYLITGVVTILLIFILVPSEAQAQLFSTQAEANSAANLCGGTVTAAAGGQFRVTCPVSNTGVNSNTINTGVNQNTNNSGVNQNTNSGGRSVSISNPLKADSITAFFIDIIEVVLVFATPIIVFFIILAGFKYVLARGNPEKVKEANQALLYAVIGGVLILGAFVILQVIQGTIDAITR